MKNRHKLAKELKSQKMRFDFKVMLPRDCEHRAFYVRIDEKTNFRIYKVQHLFSSVGGAWIIEFYVSFRNLKKLKEYQKKHQWRDLSGSFGIDCSPDDGIKIMDSLKKYGKCDLRRYFCG